MVELSHDAVQRGTFLYERDSPGAIGCYVDELSRMRETLSRSPGARGREQGALEQAARHVTDVRAMEWPEILEELVGTGGWRESPYGAFQPQHEELEPYARPFDAAARELAGEVWREHWQALCADEGRDPLAGLTRGFIARAQETSRYVLHLVYRRSGAAYQDWVREFDCADGGNPWPAIAEEFPVLLRLLACVAKAARMRAREALVRFAHDREALEATFGVPRAARLIAIDPDLSDPHRGGRTVMRFAFENGRTLIYKPKPVDIEAAFNAFAVPHGGRFGLRSLTVLPRSGYGWVEDAGAAGNTPGPFADPKATGQATAAFWLLNATDLHFENVRPGRDGLCALDLETLLAAPIAGRSVSMEPRWRAHTVITTLLFDTGLAASRRTPNISGFDPAPAGVAAFPRVAFVIDGDDVAMRVMRPAAPEPGDDPLIPLRPSADVERVIDGFRGAVGDEDLQVLRDFVDDLYPDCTLRLVLRDTAFYLRVLERMRQPRFLRDGANLSLDLMTLHAGVRAGSSGAEALHAVVDDEIRQLLVGDVPYFTYKAGGMDLWISEGRLQGFFATSGRDHAIAKMGGVEPSDIAEQSSLLSVAVGGPPIPERHADRRYRRRAAGDDELAHGIADLGRFLLRGAYRPVGAPARWLSMYGDVGGEDLRIGAGDRAFFGGAWGILLALQAVETVVPADAGCADVSAFLDEQARLWAGMAGAIAEERQHPVEGMLGFAGLGGEVFAQATLLETAPNRWHWLRGLVGEGLEESHAAVARDRWLDVIGGAAGLALGCERLLAAEVAPEWAAMAVATQRRVAERLVEVTKAWGDAAVWRCASDRNPLLGYAHGWAGILMALQCALRRVPDDVAARRIGACLDAAAMFPSRLLERDGRWLDYRVGTQGPERSELPPLNRSWCNGSAGVLRAMLEVKHRMPPIVRRECERQLGYLRATLGRGEACRFCCGEVGVADLLLDLHRRASSDARATGDEDAVSRIVARTTAAGAAAPPERLFPGLFQGIGGIAYTAARFRNPELPSLSGG